MLAMILLSLGVITMLFGCMLWNSSRRDKEVDRLLDDLAREEKEAKPAQAGKPEAKKQAWEKDGDWWKGD